MSYVTGQPCPVPGCRAKHGVTATKRNPSGPALTASPPPSASVQSGPADRSRQSGG